MNRFFDDEDEEFGFDVDQIMTCQDADPFDQRADLESSPCVIVECKNERQQERFLQLLLDEGLTCRALL